MKNKITIVSTVLLTVLFISVLLFAYPNGYTGATKKTGTTGCSCHTLNTNIIGSVTGPDTVNTGQSVTYTITVTRSGSTAKAGCNIAVRLGTLTPGTGLKLVNGELTQSSAWTLTSGTTNRTFTYTAPSSPGTDTIWSTVAVGYSNGWNWSPEKRVIVRNPTGIIKSSTPIDFSLKQNFPNPFNPSTAISFDIPKASDVRLTVYDMLGNEVITLLNGKLNTGSYEVKFDGGGYSSGIYFYILKTDNYTETRKMSLIK